MRWFAYATWALAFGCGNSTPPTASAPAEPATTASKGSAAPEAPKPPPDVPCTGDKVPKYENGAEKGTACVAQLAAPLTLLDLADAWTPTLFAPQPDGTAPDYRANYLAIASERDPKGKVLTDMDALQELYGVIPSFAIVRARLADTKRHECHAAIDSAPIKLIDKAFSADNFAEVQSGNETRQYLERSLKKMAAAEKLSGIEALADVPKAKSEYTRWKKLDDRYRGIMAVQKHLVCEGWLSDKEVTGKLDWHTGEGVEKFQRRNFLMPTERIDEETREAFATDSRELDFRFALRVLRERVIDASGLIEDGTAGEGPVKILDRWLDPAAMRAARGADKPMANAAPDLISPATEAAAKALGWTDPAKTLASMEKLKDKRVVVALPPVPAYHAKHMELNAEIDRGDVWYDMKPIARTVAHRPTLVLYADDHGTRRPLVRWPTTIGGWADQKSEAPEGSEHPDKEAPPDTNPATTADGADKKPEIIQKWKESDVGPRVWRNIMAAPTWLPPDSTPDRELLVNLWNGHYALKKAVFGPGPHAAFGMALMMHNIVEGKKKDGTELYSDNGIGTHGSSSVTSIVHGTSHGCHRLYNQLAVRLADFLLHHRDHVAKGQTKDTWVRVVTYKPPPPKNPDDPPGKEEKFTATLKTRGFEYALTPPVPVNVLAGNIMTERKIPPPPYIPPPPPPKPAEGSGSATTTATTR